MKLAMALWVIPDVEGNNENLSLIDYTAVDFAKLHSLITQLFGFGQYPKISVTNDVINSLDWDTSLVFGESYSLSYLEEFEALSLGLLDKQFVQKIVDLSSRSSLLHQHDYDRKNAPPPVCIPIIVKDANLTNLREWLIHCREKIHLRDECFLSHPEINPNKDNGLLKFRSKGHLRDSELNELSKIFNVKFKSEVMFSFMSKKSMNAVLGMKKTHLKLCKKTN